MFCQTGLPYRNPGDAVRIWERMNGHVHLKVLAGDAMHPQKGQLVPLGLPFGPKPRLILTHLNAEALRTGSEEIEIESSLTAFVRRLSLDLHGRNMRTIKDQLSRLSASSVRLGIVRDGRAITVNSQIVMAFDLWFPKDARQRVLWPSTVRLSLDYFESLQRHAVPLDERAIAALSHSAMGLDIYTWLAQRLHCVRPGKPAFIPWAALRDQFGWHYRHMRKFKQVFRQTLDMVLMRDVSYDGRLTTNSMAGWWEAASLPLAIARGRLNARHADHGPAGQAVHGAQTTGQHAVCRRGEVGLQRAQRAAH